MRVWFDMRYETHKIWNERKIFGNYWGWTESSEKLILSIISRIPTQGVYELGWKSKPFRKLYLNLSRVKNKSSLFWQMETISIIPSIFSVKYPWISSLYIEKCSTYIHPNLLVTVIKVNFLIWKGKRKKRPLSVLCKYFPHQTPGVVLHSDIE